MPRILEGKVAIVTNTSSELGREIARRLASCGACVACLDQNISEAELTSQVVSKEGGSSIAYEQLVDSFDQSVELIKKIESEMGAPQVICNSLCFGKYSYAFEETPENFDKTFRLTVGSIFMLVKASLPHLLGAQGSVINVVSSFGIAPQAYCASFSAASAALIAYTKALALEFLERRVRFNVVSVSGFGSVFTPESGFPPGMSSNWLSKAKSPIGDQDNSVVARAVEFLANPENYFITGATIQADGGVSI